MTEASWPKMLYRNGGAEQAVFDTADDVPAGEGWQTYAETYGDPLDHDGDGRKGGSRPKAKAK